MRTWLTNMIVASLLALASACGDDGNGGIDGGVGGPDAGGGGIPQITRITWAPAAGCSTGVASNYTITITAVDSNTSTDQLTYQGMVLSCTPAITMATQTVNCPNLAAYTASVTVSDPEGNMSSKNFMISPCSGGMVE
jgi:hypothetical protein